MKYINKTINMYKNLPLALKSSIIYLVVSLIQKGLGFISSPIYTRLLTSDEYGSVSVYLSMEQLLGIIAMFCLSAGCFDIGMQDYKEDRDNFIFNTIVLSNFITLVCGSVLVLVYPLIKDYIGVSPLLLITMFVSFFFQPAFIFWTRKARFEYKYKTSGLLTALSAIISILVSIIAIFFWPENKVEARIIGTLAPMLIIYLFFWIHYWTKAKSKINFCYLKFAFFFNLPLIPHYLSSYILNSFDRLMIANLVGNSQAAYYSLAYSTAAIITMIWTAVNSSLVPFLLNKYENKDYDEASKVLNPVLIMFAFLCMGIVLVAPEVIKILGTIEYYEAIYVIPPIVGGVFFQSLYYVFTNVLYYYKKPHYVMTASVLTALLNLLLNYVFISLFGYIAAGYTTLFCYMLQAVMDFFIAKKIIGKNIFDIKTIIFLSLLVIIISLFSNILYLSNTVRYICLVIFIIILIIRKDDIVKIIKKKTN